MQSTIQKSEMTPASEHATENHFKTNDFFSDQAIEAAAKKDAEICGRTYTSLSKYEKKRFNDRAKEMIQAAISHQLSQNTTD